MYYQRRIKMTNWKKLVIAIQLGLVCSFGSVSHSWADTAIKPKLESLAELNQSAPVGRHLNIQQWQTTAGSKVLFVEAHELPMFDIQLTFAAGSSRDDDKPGLALLTNGMLNEGVKGMDVTAIAKTFEGVGANFGNGSYRDMAVVSLRSLTDPKKSQVALDLLTKVISEPTFPESSFERIKNQLFTSFEIDKKTPGRLITKEFYNKLYGDHPYAHSSDGNPESIKAITIADLKKFYQETYNSKNVVIAIVGDLSKKQAEELAEKISSSLPKGEALAAVVAPKPVKAGNYHTEFSSQQTHIVLGQLGVTRNDPDYPALYVGNQILGGSGLTSRLMQEVRERRGLTYGIYSGFSTMQAAGPFSIGLQTRAEMADGSLVLIKDIVREYLANGPTEQELNDAKREISGSFPLSNASNGNIVSQLGAIGFYNLPLNYLEDFIKQIEALTAEQIKQAMNKHLKMDDFIVVTVGPTVPQQPLPAPTASKKQVMGVPH